MKAVTVLAIAGVLVGSYLGGQMTSPTKTASYEFAEVYEAVGTCTEGTFMGGCADCIKCAPYEYNGGGCSYFKDTLCVLCTDIKHCSTITTDSGTLIPAITCTDSFDHVCSECENGYYDVDCKPCQVCEQGFYEASVCTQNSNTVCAACTTCGSTEFLSKACTYTSDSECTDCTVCTPGDYSEHKCQQMETVYTETADTVCSTCPEPADGMFVSELCTITTPTKFTPCDACTPREEYIDSACEAGSWDTSGAQIECNSCTKRRNTEYTVWHCDSMGFKDSLHTSCSDCQDGEYLFAECTASSDTLCPDCKAVPHCQDGATVCSNADDSTCTSCSQDFFGATCAYEKSYSACGSMTTRERRADAYGYTGETNDEFIAFCLQLCDEFPDCMAFEIEDGGDSADASCDESLGGRGAQCYFKSSYTALSDDYSQDCYSNIVRQGQRPK